MVTSVTPPPNKQRSGSGPHRRTAQTVGDVLLDILAGRGRVASLSIKDRSAILMAALRAQICYWFNNKSGEFVTSPSYRDQPHRWVKSFNKSKLADRWINKDWNRLRPDLDYTAFSGPDDVIGEGSGYQQGRTFPHPTTLGTGTKARETYYQAVEASPFGNDLLLEFAKTAIVAENLGQTDKIDLLCVSFSSNDLVGHSWGPDSQEVLDMTLRSDVLIKTFLEFLDAKVGKGKYVFAVSADHGVCPLPEVAAAQGKNAGRVPAEVLSSLAEAHLNNTFLPKGEKLSWFDSPASYNPWVYLNLAAIKAVNLDRAKVERTLADWLNEQPGIEKAFTRTEVMAADANAADPLLAAVRKSFRAESSGDVMIVVKPYHLIANPLKSNSPQKIDPYRTTHGTPHPYDTHVPLLVMGPGIDGGGRNDRVAPQSIAAILAESLRIPPPNGTEFPVPEGLFRR